MYSLSQIKVYRTKKIWKDMHHTLKYFFLEGVGAWVLEGLISALPFFILFEVYITMYYFYIIRIFRKYFTDLKT